MRVAAFQFDVRRGDVDANLEAVRAGLEHAAAQGVELVGLPEMWPTSFDEASAERLEQSERAVELLGRWSSELDLVVAGSAFGSPGGGSSGPAPTNRLHVFDRGELVLAYDKVHLFSPTAESETFSAGTEPPRAAETAAGRLAGAVCYDLRFGPLTRECFLEGAEVLVCPAQWPRPREGHWRALLRGRAVENQCVVIGANRTGSERVGRRELELEFPGNSLVVGPDGAVLAEGKGQSGLVTAEVELASVRRLRRRVPVVKDQRPAVYRAWEERRKGERG